MLIDFFYTLRSAKLPVDVGGTMDEHIHRVEEIFSAVKTEFKHLEFYYFHNCVYDFMWKNNRLAQTGEQSAGFQSGRAPGAPPDERALA